MARFSASNILGDPFALATVSISILAWLISFIGSIIANVQTDFPNYVWWAVAYMICVIAGIIVVMGSDTSLTYSNAITGYLSAGLVFTTLAVNSLVYQPQSSKQAAAAGFILLSMIIVSFSALVTGMHVNDDRSFGYSTLVPPPKQATAGQSTRSH